MISTNEPVICWMKMITRPFIQNTDKGFVFAQCNTFNAILSSIVTKMNNHYVLNVQLPDIEASFDLFGHLTSYGKMSFWKELNTIMHELKEDLKARDKNIIVQKYEEEQTRQQHTSYPGPSIRVSSKPWRKKNFGRFNHTYHENRNRKY